MSDDLFLTVLRMRIKKLRIERRLRQEDVAEKAEMLLQTYQRFEAYGSGQAFNPTLRNVMSIADSLAITLSDLTQEPTESELEALYEADTRRVWRDGKVV